MEERSKDRNDADEIRQVVEQYGIRIGAVMNWPPMAGRMMATLMLNDGPMTADELREALGASAGAISGCSRILVESGVVMRIKSKFTRKKTFAYRPDAWVACLQHQVAMATELRDLADTACDRLKKRPPHILSRFEDMRTYQNFMANSLAGLEWTVRALTTRPPEQDGAPAADDRIVRALGRHDTPA